MLSGTYLCDGSITISDEVHSLCVSVCVLVCLCVSACVCVCVCVCVSVRTSFYHTEL